MKDRNSGDLRRLGRGPGGYSRRIRQGYLARLSDVWSEDQGEVRVPRRKGEAVPVRAPRRVKTNWRVTCDRGDVVAIEPNREFESVFEGGDDPFMDALEYAAKKIREGR